MIAETLVSGEVLPMVRHCYDGLQAKISHAGGVDCSGDEKITKDSEADACDINKIVARYEKSGILPEFREDGKYGIDTTGIPDYRAAMDFVSLANEQFAALDARVRARYDNDPAKFLDAIQDPARVQELYDLGLAVVKPVSMAVPPQAGASGSPAPVAPAAAAPAAT